MQEVTFTLQTITPLFLAGADQNIAELRPPTFRGEMRYWLRTLVGGCVEPDTTGLRKVVEAEQAVFGATEHSSPVRIRLRNIATTLSPYAGAGAGVNTGKGYLFWSMNESRKEEKGNPKPARKSFLPGMTTFQLVLSASETNTDALKQAIASIWLLVNLGGIGARSRRCAGNLTVTNVENNITSLSFSQQTAALTLKKYLEEGLITARKLYGYTAHPHKDTAPFDVLAEGVSHISILLNKYTDAQGTLKEKYWGNVNDALNDIGIALKMGRTEQMRPKGLTKIPVEDRQIFGLPLQEVSQERRASPLLLKVAKLQVGFTGLAVLFKTQDRDYTLIDNFFKQFSNVQEVNV